MTRTSLLPNPNQAADRIADSVITLLVMTVLQRAIGFCRSLFVCRVLDPAELGQWDMALGFIELAAPIAMLGLPGSFGRYVEHYRQRNQLRSFLRRTIIVTGISACVCVAIVITQRHWFSYAIYGTANQTPLVLMIAAGMFAVILYYFLTTLLTSLRRSRIVSYLEFTNSFLFAVLAIGMVVGWRATSAGILAGYLIACLTTATLAFFYLRPIWQGFQDSAERPTHQEMWAKLLPFAFWVWGTNWLANVFELADRYMIVHYGGFDATRAMVEVGNYHSSRVFPLLLVSITSLLATMLTPYLSHDWESGGSRAASARLNFTLKLLGLFLLIGSLGIVMLAPILFDIAFKGKFSGGLAVLPLTSVYCVWLGMARVAQKYLWCTERVRMAALAWLLGVVLNIGLNCVLLPRYGLIGAVAATAAGNCASLLMMYLFNRVQGMQIDASTWLVTFAPASLILGPTSAAIVTIVILYVAMRSTWILSDVEKHQLKTVVREYFQRISVFIPGGANAAVKEASS